MRSMKYVCSRSIAGIAGTNPSEYEYSSRGLSRWRPLRRADHSFTGVQPAVFLIVWDAEPQPRGGLGPISVVAPQKDGCISGCQPSPLTLRTPITRITSHGKGSGRPSLIFLPGCVCWGKPCTPYGCSDVSQSASRRCRCTPFYPIVNWASNIIVCCHICSLLSNKM